MAQQKVTAKTMLRCALGFTVASTVLVTAPACGSEKPAESALKGLLALEPGKIEGNKLSGTWFKMVQPGGNPQEGPFMPNANSPVPQGSATLLSPGTDGGLILGDYQGEPDPAFDEATGYSLASRVTQPTKFFNIEFGISTNKIDPQTQRELLAPHGHRLGRFDLGGPVGVGGIVESAGVQPGGTQAESQGAGPDPR